MDNWRNTSYWIANYRAARSTALWFAKQKAFSASFNHGETISATRSEMIQCCENWYSVSLECWAAFARVADHLPTGQSLSAAIYALNVDSSHDTDRCMCPQCTRVQIDQLINHQHIGG